MVIIIRYCELCGERLVQSESGWVCPACDQWEPTDAPEDDGGNPTQARESQGD
jgi:hypothetical protein